MRTPRVFRRGRPGRPPVGAGRRLLRQRRPRPPRTRFPSNTGCSPRRSPRSTGSMSSPLPVGPADLRRHRRHAPDARSALELLRSRSSTRRCASGRKATTTASASRSRSIDGDITVMSLFEGSPAYRAGIRRGDVIARIEGDERQGLDDATRRSSSSRDRRARRSTSSIRRPGYDELIDHGRRARRDQHRHRARRVHDRRASTGYIRLRDFSETTDERSRRRAEEADRRRA